MFKLVEEMTLFSRICATKENQQAYTFADGQRIPRNNGQFIAHDWIDTARYKWMVPCFLLVGYYTTVVDLEKSPSNVELFFCTRAPSARITKNGPTLKGDFSKSPIEGGGFPTKNFI